MMNKEKKSAKQRMEASMDEKRETAIVSRRWCGVMKAVLVVVAVVYWVNFIGYEIRRVDHPFSPFFGWGVRIGEAFLFSLCLHWFWRMVAESAAGSVFSQRNICRLRWASSLIFGLNIVWFIPALISAFQVWYWRPLWEAVIGMASMLALPLCLWLLSEVFVIGQRLQAEREWTV